MRKIVLPMVAAGAVLAIAAPAAAQYYPSQSYGYNGFGQARELHARIDRIEQQIDRLDRYNAAPGGMTDRLRDQARRLEYRLGSAARYGLNPHEANEIQARIGQLEQRVQYISANRYGRYGYNGYRGNYGYGDNQGDRRWNGDRDEGNRDRD
jgi:tetrahydromethanopterin S-methyltransferase subunit G